MHAVESRAEGKLADAMKGSDTIGVSPNIAT
jgi:hypothetical protein